MNKLSLTFCVLFLSVILSGYDFQKSTQTIVISGNVKTEQKFGFTDLQKFKLHSIGDVVITNHKGEPKGTAKAMKGVLLKDVLESIVLDTDNPKLFSEYYFVCRASDGYKAVYSWNELFNTTTGNTVYIVLEKDEKSLTNSEDSILMISTEDMKTGRRYVKNLETIIVGRV